MTWMTLNGVSRACPKFLTTRYLRMGKDMDFKFGRYIHRQAPLKPIKNFGEKGAWAYPATAQLFKVPLIISGTGKATNFKFCTHIHSINWKKSPLKICGKVAVGVARDSRNF